MPLHCDIIMNWACSFFYHNSIDLLYSNFMAHNTLISMYHISNSLAAYKTLYITYSVSRI